MNETPTPSALRPWTWVAVALASSAGDAVHARTLAMDCATGAVTTPHEISAVRVEIAAPDSGAWLKIEEVGQDFDVSSSRAEILSLQTPPRFGVTWVRASGPAVVEIQRSRPIESTATLRLSLDCSESSASEASYFMELSTFSRDASSPNPTALAQAIKESHRLSELAPDPVWLARVQHLRAQILFVNGKSREAALAFGQAENAWMDAGLFAQALAARVGRVEELIRLGDLQTASNLTTTFSRREVENGYFGARLSGSTCTIFATAGRLDDAHACYSNLAARMLAIDEKLDAASASMDLAGVLVELGRLQEASDAYATALDEVSGKHAEMLKGRASVGLLGISLKLGQLGRAVHWADEALRWFGIAGNRRWQATTLIKLAEFYAQVGADHEALKGLDEALAMISEQDAPGRVAAIIFSRGKIRSDQGDVSKAKQDFDQAGSIFTRLGMTLEMHRVQVAKAELLAQWGALGEAASVAQVMASSEKPSSDFDMAMVELRIRSGEPELATQAISRMLAGSTSILRSVRIARLEAWLLALQGNHPAALAGLMAKAQSLSLLARQSGSPLLAELVGGRQIKLRQVAVDVIAGMPDDAFVEGSGRAQLLWNWIAAMRPADVARETAADTVSAAIGRSLAREFLAAGGKVLAATDPQSFRDLLALLGRDSATTTASDSAALAAADLPDFQSRLSADETVLVFVGGERSALRLRVTRDATDLAVIANARSLRTSIDDLRGQLASLDGNLATINARAAGLSAALLKGLPDGVPARLVVMAGTYDADLPWAVLRWPHGDEPIGLSTDFSMAVVNRPAEGLADGGSAHVHVLNAPQGSLPQLPYLEAAAREYQLVDASLAGSHRVDNSPAQRSALIDALQQSGAWVHVAAHGRGRDNRLGGSGLWLEPTPPETTPDYFSGLDLLGLRSRAQLVLLNACDVGGTSGYAPSPTQLPPALIRSGVSSVVAPQWPVSDSATYQWIPAFYAHVGNGTPREVAEALRVARNRLYATRSFRHPFYWASLSHTMAMQP